MNIFYRINGKEYIPVEQYDKEIKELEKEIERLNAIIDKLNEKGKFLTDVANEKQNRIDRACTYNNYLREKCKFRLNDGHLRKMGKILIGEETELREIPRIVVNR